MGATVVRGNNDAAEDRTEQRSAFADALFAVMHQRGVTHRELGEAIGASHTVFSGWRSGDHEPAPATVFAVERYLELPPGHLSQHLGYVPPEARTATFPSVLEDVIDADPGFDNRARRVLKLMAAEFRVPQQRRRRA